MLDTAPFRLALVAHSPDVVDCVYQVAEKGKYELQSHLVDFDSAVPVAQSCLESGAEVVICHGGTGNSIVQALGQAVVAIDRTDMDVINALRLASKVDRNIILAAFLGEEHDLAVIEELLDVRIHHIAYSSSQKLFATVDKLYTEGVQVLVGGGVSSQYMNNLGGQGFVIPTNRHSARKALLQAQALAGQKRRENAQHENLLAIFRQLEDGVICIDGSGSLVFINQKALNLLKVPTGFPMDGACGFFEKLHLFDILAGAPARNNALAEISGEQFVVTTLPVTIHQGLPGAVALFRDVPSLQKISRKIGEELYAKGFVTRYSLGDIKGQSGEIHELKKKIQRFAPTDAAVLIHGETGTGKELVAHGLHAQSRRNDKAFVAINCAALPENLLESELFGYEDGAFTGARRGGKAGLFELADKGTLFLDEVGEISHGMQLRLLRVLEAKEVMRVGGSRYLPVDVRVVSASHRPLLELVAEQFFRLDLYYRLSTLKISVPPLRDRLGDATLLVQKLLHRYGRPGSVISGAITEAVMSYHWPGNVRELLAIMESYLILLQSNNADSALFKAILQENTVIAPRSKNPAQLFDPEKTLQENMHTARQAMLMAALRFHDGDKKVAAEALGISYSTLWRMQRQDSGAAEKNS